MVPSGWRTMRLGDFVALQRGHDLPEGERRTGPIPILGSFGVTGSHDTARVQGPGVTIGRSGASFGVATYSAVDYWPLNTVLYVTDFHGNDERFAHYFLKAMDFARYNSGSAQASLNRNHIHPLPVAVPPVPEQRAIARVLGSLDDKIELNRRMNETLEAVAQAIFRSWFVDFDPVRAKAEGRRPTGMDAETAALFPGSLEASAAGSVPRGWTVGPLSHVAMASREMVDPGAHPDEVFDHYSIPAYDVDRRPVTEPGASIGSSKLAVPADAVLLSRLNPRFPRVWMPTPSTQRRAICSTEFLVASPLPGYSREYLCGLFASGAFGARLSTLVTGTSGSHQRVRPDDVLAMPVVTPGPKLVGHFTQLVRPLHELIATHRAEGATLAAIRGELLPKLISGRLRVRDVHGAEEGKHETKESQQPEAVGLPDQGGVHKLRPGCQTRP
jgi:type I restriction enzyme S subunit